MSQLVVRYGVLHLRARPAFEVLTRSVIAQQISTKAAETIRTRLINTFGLCAEEVSKAPVVQLRQIGLSERKAQCITELAKRSVSGEFDDLAGLADAAVASRLRHIPGVGAWTAEMFLIFGLARPNIWPTSDAGLRSAARRLYAFAGTDRLHELGSRFAPYRSLAALYLWRSLENTAQSPSQL